MTAAIIAKLGLDPRTSPDELKAFIRTYSLDPSEPKHARIIRKQFDRGPLSTLTRTEHRVLARASLTDKEIADVLEISIHTVRAHFRAIAQKLGTRSRTEAALRQALWGME